VAIQDLEEIDEYISKQNPTAAANIIDLLEEACDLLTEHPGIGRVHDDILAGVMSWPVGSYIIFYSIASRPLAIVRILHGSRDLPVAFGER